MQWYLQMNEQGKRRRHALPSDLTTNEGALTAANFIEWVAAGQPGHNYARKAPETVRTTVRCSATLHEPFAADAWQPSLL